MCHTEYVMVYFPASLRIPFTQDRQIDTHTLTKDVNAYSPRLSARGDLAGEGVVAGILVLRLGHHQQHLVLLRFCY